MNRTDYEAKINDLLSDTTVYQKVRKNKWETEVNKFNKKVNTIITTHNLDKDFFKNKQTINPKIPYIYGLPKTHKENVPLRPIISNVNSPPYKLAKYLANNLSRFLGEISGCHLRHSGDLLTKIRNASPRKTMVSYDVRALFTNIPTDKALTMLRSELKNQP